MIETLHKGALVDLPDSRDYPAAPLLSALPPVNWNQPFTLPDPGNEDQGSSESCVSQSFSYYHTQLHAANYSRRDLYSRIFQPQGGAYLRDGAAQLIMAGQDTRDHMPDPQPETETGMRDKTGMNPAAEAAHEELTYNSVNPDIESVAQAIANFKGCVFGVNGTNEGWQDIANPRPPASGETQWSHALYGMGYHLHDGVKCIIAKSSWCSTGIYQHHIKENYFESGNVFSPWTLIPKGTTFMIVPKRVVKQDGVTHGVLLDSPNGAQIIWATDENQWRSWNKADSYQLPTVDADGSTNWTVDFTLPF